jgi:LmbE family N-acetylglucosaminyl deacetylase
MDLTNSNKLLTPKRNMTVLALGPHVDDIELGCGGTILRLIQEFGATVHTAVFCGRYRDGDPERRPRESAHASQLFGYTSQKVFDHRDTHLPDDWREIQEEMRELRESVTPDLILSPNPNDLHQDHRAVAEAAMREFRYDETIWCYEINAYGVQNRFEPNVFVDLGDTYLGPLPEESEIPEGYPAHLHPDNEPSYAAAKALMTHVSMESQRKSPLLDPEFMMAIMRVRAVARGVGGGLCEAFVGKAII